MKKEKFTKTEEVQLRQLLELLNEFRDLDSEMQMPQAVTLVTVALDEGLALGEIAERTQQAMSSASRNVASLSQVHRKGKPGHGLIINKEDPNERRRKQHLLTPKGLAFVRRLIERMGS